MALMTCTTMSNFSPPSCFGFPCRTSWEPKLQIGLTPRHFPSKLVLPKVDLLPNGDICYIKVFFKEGKQGAKRSKHPIRRVPATHPCSSIISCSSMHLSSTLLLRSWSRISR